MFDPNLPQEQTLADAAQMRAQFNGLRDLIDAIQSVGSATVDAVNTLAPGDPATVDVSVTGDTLHFTFGIPAGADGSNGSDGGEGQPGPQGEPGPPGEVTFQQLTDALMDTSHNCTTVSPLSLTVSDPPTQMEMQAIADKLDELINTLLRV